MGRRKEISENTAESHSNWPRWSFYADSIDDQTGEQRWIALGMAQPAADAGVLLVVTHAYREDEHGKEVVPIIYAREVEKRDIRRYRVQALDEE